MYKKVKSKRSPVSGRWNKGGEMNTSANGGADGILLALLEK